MRALARAAGVSPMAPYRHFADRAALVTAVADEGFKRLYAQLRAAAESPEQTLGQPQQTARGGLQAIALAYVQFALEHPDEYRVISQRARRRPPRTHRLSRNESSLFPGGNRDAAASEAGAGGDPHEMAPYFVGTRPRPRDLAIDGQCVARARHHRRAHAHCYGVLSSGWRNKSELRIADCA